MTSSDSGALDAMIKAKVTLAVEGALVDERTRYANDMKKVYETQRSSMVFTREMKISKCRLG